ncbi:MAG: glycosyltransferase [Candidatus Omnitrophota bacterium]
MAAKRIILMYITQVSGHRSAALAIEKALKMLEPAAETLNINAFNYTNPISEKIIHGIYMGIIKKTPRIWDYLYDNPAFMKRIEKLKQGLHKFNAVKLDKIFSQFKPDAVACTQAFPCGMVADYKKIYGSQIPLVAVLTDFVPHSYWIYDSINYYITPTEEISRRLIDKGVDAGKVKPFGIPFDPYFNEKKDKGEILNRLGLGSGTPKILIMGGSHGLGPMKTIIDSLDKMDFPVQQIVVTGTNKKLFNSLQKMKSRFKNKMLLYEYSHNIPELMEVSDIIITKPGGVTTAEVLAKQVPMVIINPLPGQEANNTAYLIKENAAIKVDEPKEIGRVVKDLINSPSRLEEIRKCQGLISKPDASVDIARLLLGL